MATERLVAGTGVGLTWTACANTAINIASTGLVSGNAVLGETQIDNSSNLDELADLELVLASAAYAAPNFVGVYLYPLNSDNSTYGDGRFGSSAAGPPPSDYYVGKITLVAGTQAEQGVLRKIELPPGKFKFCFWNQGGIAWPTTGNLAKYRTFNRQVS